MPDDVKNEDVNTGAKAKATTQSKSTAREKALEKQLEALQEQMMLIMRNVNQQPVVADTQETIDAKQKAAYEKWLKKRKARKAKHPERVPMFFFGDDDRYQGVIYASVNGKPVLIPRNMQVLVPWNIATVLEQQRKQDKQTMERRQKLAAPADLPRA